MLSLRTLKARGATSSSLCAQCLRTTRSSTAATRRPLSSLSLLQSHNSPQNPHFQQKSSIRTSLSSSSPRLYPSSISRPYSSSPAPSSADDILILLQDQYATARDEFEIATEETDKKTTYAESDREAAREELERLKEMFAEACKGEFAEEVQRRVGPRIRELESAVVELERRAVEE